MTTDHIELPEWVPADAWQGYIDMRKQQKKPMTPRAKKLAINTLLDLKDQGQDIEKVLEQSEFRCWIGLFPVHAQPQAVVAEPFKPKVVADNWWLSDAGIKRKGEEIGLPPRGTENWSAYKDRIFSYLNKRQGAA